MEPTGSMNVVITPLQRILIFLNHVPIFTPQGEWAFKNEEYLDHLVEIAVCDGMGENQATKHLRAPVGIIDMDVTICRTIQHYPKQWRSCQ